MKNAQQGFRIGSLQVGAGHPPLIIAEMSGNHNGSLERALQIADAAAAAGAHCLKLQTYTADTMTLDLSEGEFFVSEPDNLWKGKSLYQLYKEAHTPWEWHKPIFERCRALGILAFSSPFDTSAVELLESLGAPCYKIASFENIDLPLIRRVAATGKPIIMSTGMASMEELQDAVHAAREAGCRELALLKCTSAYPAVPESANLATMADLAKTFGCPVGLSDHTMGIGVAVGAAALGAALVEKHFTLSRADGGVDAAFSLEPAELRALVEETGNAWRAIGGVFYGPTEKEKASLAYRRSIYVCEDIKQGELLTAKNVRCIRPGRGLPPKHLDAVLGRRASRDAAKGTPVSWDLLA